MNTKENLPNAVSFTHRFRDSILKTMLRGVLIALPIVVVLFLLYLIFKMFLSVVTPVSLLLASFVSSPVWVSHLLTFVLLGAIFYSLGVMVKYNRQRRWLKKFEMEYLSRIPLYDTVREAVDQFTKMKEVPFRQVVLVDIFDSGVWMTGFVTERISENMCTVFVPTAPNPTNGNIYHVPCDRLRFVKTKSETAMRTIVGMGTGSSIILDELNPPPSAEGCEEARPQEVVVDSLPGAGG
jgi:uncharacterized membrane protein